MKVTRHEDNPETMTHKNKNESQVIQVIALFKTLLLKFKKIEKSMSMLRRNKKV